MKKSVIKTLSACLMVVLLLSTLSVMAYAAVNSTFFRTNCSGYRCTGSGTLSSTQASSVFNATANSLEPILPGDECSSKIWILGYGSSGQFLGSVSSVGTTYATATFTPSGPLSEAGYNYTFLGGDLGTYLLENP